MGGGKYDAPEGPSAQEMISVVNAQIAGQKELLAEYMDFQREQLDWQKDIATDIAGEQLYAMELQNRQAEDAFVRDVAFGQYAEELYAEKLADASATQQERHVQKMWEKYTKTDAEKRFIGKLKNYAEPAQVQQFKDMLHTASATPDAFKKFTNQLRKYEDPRLVDDYIKALAAWKDPKQVQQFVNTLTDYEPPAELQRAINQMADVRTPHEYRSAIRQLATYGIPEEQQAAMDALSSATTPEAMTEAITALREYQTPEEQQEYMDALRDADTPPEMLRAIQELEDYDSTARIREAEGIAAQDVQASAEGARQAAMQRLEQFGIDPSQVRTAGLDHQLRSEMAANQALASSQARRDIQERGLEAQVQAGQLAVGEREAGLERMGERGRVATEAALQELNAAVQAGQLSVGERNQLLDMLVQAGRISADEYRTQLDAAVQAGQMAVGERDSKLAYLERAAGHALTRDQAEHAAQREAAQVSLDAATRELQMLGTAADAQLQSKLRELGMDERLAQMALGEVERKVRLRGMAMDTAVESTLRELGMSEAAAQTAKQFQMDRYNAATMASESARRIQAEDLARSGEIANLFRGLPAQASNIYRTGQGSATVSLGATQAPIDSATQIYGTGAGMSRDISGQAIGMFDAQVGKYGVDVANADAQARARSSGFGNFTSLLGALFKEGGEVLPSMSPSGGAIPDDVPAGVNVGEYIIPEEVVRYHGIAKFEKMKEQAHQGLGIPEKGGK